MNSSGFIDKVKFRREIENRFGLEFLKLAGFNWKIYDTLDSPYTCVINMKYIEYLVFINFFFNSLSSFFNYKTKIPTGKREPFPCENYFCEKYKQKVIEILYVEQNDKKDKLIVRFECNYCKCGYEKVFRVWDWKLVEIRAHNSKEWKANVLDLIYSKGFTLDKVSDKLNLDLIEIETLILENERKLQINPIFSAPKDNNSIDWARRDKQVLLYLKKLVNKAIIRGNKDVYFSICFELDRANISEQLPYLPITKEYIKKHKLLSDHFYKKTY